MKPHICKAYVCIAVTYQYHLHSEQNDLDLLCATAVTQSWNGNGYQNKTTQKVDPGIVERKIPLLLLPGFEPMTF